MSDPHGWSKDISKVWVGFIASTRHNIIFKLEKHIGRVVQVQENTWWVGFHHYKESACLVWLVQRICDPGGAFTFIELQKLKQPQFMTITNPDEVTAQSFQCRSWAWQVAQGVSANIKFALIFALLDEPKPVLVVAAKAFVGSCREPFWMSCLNSRR